MSLFELSVLAANFTPSDSIADVERIQCQYIPVTLRPVSARKVAAQPRQTRLGLDSREG